MIGRVCPGLIDDGFYDQNFLLIENARLLKFSYFLYNCLFLVFLNFATHYDYHMADFLRLQVLTNDFFLVACLDDFIENARLFIFETFCRIHQCLSIK